MLRIVAAEIGTWVASREACSCIDTIKDIPDTTIDVAIPTMVDN